jgi:hypothetical protein
MALWELSGKLSYEAGSSNHQGSILLVDIMNALGFSKNEREINRHHIHLKTNPDLMQIKNKRWELMRLIFMDGLCVSLLYRNE